MTKDEIIMNSLKTLRHDQDEHWNKDGTPKVELIRAIVGMPELTKAEIAEAFPDFDRAWSKTEQEAEAPVIPDPVTNPDPAVTFPPPPVDDPSESQIDPPGYVPPVVDPHLQIEIEDPEIMAMDYPVVAGNYEYVCRGIAEFNRQAAILSKRKSQIDAKLKDVSRRAEILSAVEQRLAVLQKKTAPNPFKEFQKRSQEQREKKAAAAREFVASGVNAKALAQVLDPRSPIDKAMAAKKPGIGTQRPVYPKA